MYHPDFVLNSWQLLLVFWVVCLGTFVICAFCNKFLPMVDTICAAWTGKSDCPIVDTHSDLLRHRVLTGLSVRMVTLEG